MMTMTEKSFQLKIDEELRDKLKKRAIDEKSTMNNIIIGLLRSISMKNNQRRWFMSGNTARICAEIKDER